MRQVKILTIINLLMIIQFQSCASAQIVDVKDNDGVTYLRTKTNGKGKRFFYVDFTGKEIEICRNPDVKAVIPSFSPELIEKYVSSNLYRDETSEYNGNVIVAILIDENDKIIEYRILKNIYSCEQCAFQVLELLKNIKECKSAEHNGEKVKSIVYVSIPFR